MPVSVMYEKLMRRSPAGFNTAVWRALCCVLTILLVAQNLRLWHTSHQAIAKVPPPLAHIASAPVINPNLGEWLFNATRDGNNYALNHEQCTTAFPNLYQEINRAVTLRKGKLGKIPESSTSIDFLNEGLFRLLIHKNKLRILESQNAFTNKLHYQRARAVLLQLNRALIGATAAGENLPTIAFSVNVDDRPGLPETANDTHVVWSFARKLDEPAHDRAWLMPDFNFWAWVGIAGDFAEYRDRAAERDGFIADKIPQAVWRGAKWTNPEVRGPLLEVSKGKPWADIREIHWGDEKDMMPVEDLCKYAYVVHTEGRSWSGRMKYLLQCDSVPIVHEMDWTSHYYHLLRGEGEEEQNYVPVRRKFSDLERKVQYYMKHPEEAQRISDNARAAFRNRYLTPAAQACYWRRLIKGYGEVAVRPKVYADDDDDVEVGVAGSRRGTAERRLRGISYEEFMLTEDEYPRIPAD